MFVIELTTETETHNTGFYTIQNLNPDAMEALSVCARVWNQVDKDDIRIIDQVSFDEWRSCNADEVKEFLWASLQAKPY